jgi:STE24 endopeptidase
VWAAAAWLLADTNVPDDLRLPHVDPAGLVDPATLARAERYERFRRWDFVASQLVLFGVLAVYARHGARFVRESAAGRIGTGMLLGMLGLGFVWLAELPFRLAAIWWERRYDMTDAGYLEALFANWAQLGAEFLSVSLALALVMALAGRFRRRWWLAAAPAFVAIGALFAFVYPYLTTGAKPLRDPQLAAAVKSYEQREGVEGIPVRVEKVSDTTKAPNAYAVGFGPSRSVYLWDTLLDGRFSDDEVKVVIAHELGHHSRNHIPKGLAWYALLAFPGAWLIAIATRRRGGMAEPTAVPLGLLVVVALQFAAMPLENAVSRRMEAEADWVALEVSRDPSAAEGLFAGFTKHALAEPSPPRWERVLLGSHPAIVDRVAMARAWAARAGSR